MMHKVISDESGRILVWTLVVLGIGALIIPGLLTHISTNLLASRAIEEGLKEQYAADSGVEYALLQLQYGINTGQISYTINTKGVEVTWGECINGTYKITSTATSQFSGSSTTIESYVESVSISRSVFEHAVAALGSDEECDIDLGGNAEITSDVELGGDAYANGSVCVSGNAEVDGDVSATENITTTGNAEIAGEQTEGAPPLVGPDIDTAGYKTEAMNVECAVCGDITRWGDWSPSSGDYEDPEHVEENLNISGIGTFTFEDTVCAGIDTDKDLIIEGITTVTFEGPVKVGRHLKIRGNSTVTFEDTVCVEGDLTLSGNASATFDGAVKVEGELNLEGNKDVPLGDTLYVGGDFRVSGNATIGFGGTAYICGDIIMTGNSSELVGGEAVIAEGDISLKGNSDFNEAAEDIPFVISTDGDITTLGNSDIAAILYAPNGHAYLSGNSDIYGAVVGLSVTAQGNNDVFYPSGLLEARDDLPAGITGLEIRTYNIHP
jgi:cytoskeletal protein CcmA (bactofilin family)